MITFLIFLVLLYSMTKLSEKIMRSNKKIGNLFLLFPVILLTLFCGLRYSGTDFLVYNKEFYRVQNYTFFGAIKDGVEPGLAFLMKVSYIISTENTIPYFLLISFLTNIIFCYAVKKYTNNFSFAILLYVLSFTYFSTFNISGQYIAIMITFWGMQYLIKLDKKKYLICIMIAFLFHYSSLIMLLLAIIPKNNYKVDVKKVLQVIVFGFLVLFSYPLLEKVIFFIPLLGEKYFVFLQELYNFKREASLAHILIFIIQIFFLFYYRNELFRKQKSADNQIKIYYFTMSFLISGVFVLLSQNNVFWIRLGSYFSIYIIVLISEILISIKKIEKPIWYYIVLVFYFTICLYLLLTGSGEVYPFKLRMFDSIYQLR